MIRGQSIDEKVARTLLGSIGATEALAGAIFCRDFLNRRWCFPIPDFEHSAILERDRVAEGFTRARLGIVTWTMGSASLSDAGPLSSTRIQRGAHPLSAGLAPMCLWHPVPANGVSFWNVRCRVRSGLT